MTKTHYAQKCTEMSQFADRVHSGALVAMATLVEKLIVNVETPSSLSERLDGGTTYLHVPVGPHEVAQLIGEILQCGARLFCDCIVQF